jgi:cytoskeletal protein CcmA (bactofilin family)
MSRYPEAIVNQTLTNGDRHMSDATFTNLIVRRPTAGAVEDLLTLDSVDNNSGNGAALSFIANSATAGLHLTLGRLSALRVDSATVQLDLGIARDPTLSSGDDVSPLLSLVSGASGLRVITSGPLAVGHELNVTGATTLGGTLSVTGATTLNGNLHVAGTASLEGTMQVGSLALRIAGADESEWPVLSAGAANQLDVTGDLRISGNMNVTGAIQGTLADGIVGPAQLAAGAVIAAKIADKAVTLSKIADGVLPANIGVTVTTGLQDGQSIPVPTGFTRGECVFFVALKYLLVDPDNQRTIYNCSADAQGKVSVAPKGSAVAVGVALAKKGGW